MSIPAAEPRKKWSGKKWFALVMSIVWAGIYLFSGLNAFRLEREGEPFLGSVLAAVIALYFIHINSRRFYKA